MAIIEGESGTGKSTLARFIVSNMKDTKVYWLDCANDSKVESSLKDLARHLTIYTDDKDVSHVLKEIVEVLSGNLAQEYLLILDDFCINTHILNLVGNMPVNVKALIITRIEYPEDLVNKFKIDSHTLYTTQEAIDFHYETTSFHYETKLYKSAELKTLRSTVKNLWNPTDTEIKLPVREVNGKIAHFIQIDHFIHKIAPSEIAKPLFDAGKSAAQQIFDLQLTPENVDRFISQIFKDFRSELLDQVCRILFLDGNFINLDILYHSPILEEACGLFSTQRASQELDKEQVNTLLDEKLQSVRKDLLLLQLQQNGVIYRTENCCGDKGITTHRLFQKSILENSKCDPKIVVADVLQTVEVFMKKLSGDKAYHHALKLC